MSGKVFLVGAGPGDPGLITVRGADLLRRADAVLYDALVAPSLLELAGSGCERLYVGKRAGSQAMSQQDINEQLISRAKLGKRVVRLKGGDPYLFGRGGEEALACRAAGVEIEVVPGVSSALAVPGCAGIPVTQRGVASSMLILHGRLAAPPGERPASPIDSTLIVPPPTPPPAVVESQKDPRKGAIIIRKHRSGPKGIATEMLPPPPKDEAGPGATVPDDDAQLADAQVSLEEPEVELDWQSICRAAQTIVFLMPGGHLERIRDGLIEGGCPASTPVAVIQWGTTTRQRTVISNVVDFPEAVKEAEIGSPSTVIIGEVVNLRDALNMFEERPLFGWRVAVTRPAETREETMSQLREVGATPLWYPATRTSHLAGLAAELQLLQEDIKTATHIVFSSPSGVETFYDALREAGLDIRILSSNTRVIAAGPATTAALKHRGLISVEAHTPFDFDEMKNLFGLNLNKMHVIVTESVHERGDLSAELVSRGARVTEMPLYEYVPDEEALSHLRHALEHNEVDVVSVFSPSAVHAMKKAWREDMRRLLESKVVAVAGEASAKLLQDAGVEVNIHSTRGTSEGLVREMERYRGVKFK